MSFKDNWLYLKDKGMLEIVSTGPESKDAALLWSKGNVMVAYRGEGSSPIRALDDLRKNYDNKQSYKPEELGKVQVVSNPGKRSRPGRGTKSRRNIFDRTKSRKK